MNPAIIGIILLVCCLISSSVGGYFVMNASPALAPEPETEAPEPETEAPEPEEEVINGCMDNTATNYDPDANEDDGSCTFTRVFTISDGNNCAKEVNRYIKMDSVDDDCASFVISTDKDGNIVDTSQEIKISGDNGGCVKADGSGWLQVSSCASPGTSTFTAETDGKFNVNASSPEFAEDIHTYQNYLHKTKSWASPPISDPVLTAKFMLEPPTDA